LPDLEASAPAVFAIGAAEYVGVVRLRASAGVRRWASAAQGGCHRLSGMRRVGAPRGQHFQDDTETRHALQH
jgi:hypothetical protein